MKKFKKPNLRGGGSKGLSRGGEGRGSHRGGPSRGAPGSHRGPQTSGTPQGRCVVGIHAVNELLKVRGREIEQLWLRETYEDHQELTKIFDHAKHKNVKVQLQNPNMLDKVVSANQGVMAFTQSEPEADWAKIEASEKCILIALDEVEDPHNLGAILRTAWLFGAQAILTPEHRAANLSPAVSKVAQGAAEHVPVVRESALPERLKQLKDKGFWILGLSHKATQGLYKLEVPDKVVWVLGSESSGIRKSVEGACDELIAIPQASPEASYNVSVAAAVAVSETYRQHTKH